MNTQAATPTTIKIKVVNMFDGCYDEIEVEQSITEDDNRNHEKRGDTI